MKKAGGFNSTTEQIRALLLSYLNNFKLKYVSWLATQ
jgi:hypothetical protein